jgi:hypothetical protein
VLKELLPAPVLSIGFSGNIITHGTISDEVECSIHTILKELLRALPLAIAQEEAYFSPVRPVVRLVTMGAEGADLLGIRAAIALGIDLSYVIPFAIKDYYTDFSASSAAEAAVNFSHGASLFQLPGKRDEGPRAYTRTNEIILSNSDLLIAVWESEQTIGWAEAGNAVQAAVMKGIPIVAINPKSPTTPAILSVSQFADLDAPAATNLVSRPLPADLTQFIHGIIKPPSRFAKRRGLDDLLIENRNSTAWRSEYPLLLRIAAAGPARKWKISAHSSEAKQPASHLSASFSALSKKLEAVERSRAIIDGLAVRYGTLFRSSAVGAYLFVIFGVWLSGVVGLLVPSLSVASLAIQVLVNGLVLADSAYRIRHRWQERWLDYRVAAEQLRWLGFRYLLGLSVEKNNRVWPQRSISWIEWYLERSARALGLPQGELDSTLIGAVADQLINVEIPSQIDYHRKTFRQLGLLEGRLAVLAHGALASSLAVAVLLAIAAIKAGSLDSVGWKPFALALLAVLPATMAGLNGMRVEADLVRLIERSAQTIALLFRLKRMIVAAPRDYDRVSSNMQRLASVMGEELAEWRFVIESRRSRRGWRRAAAKRRNVLHRQRAYQKRD